MYFAQLVLIAIAVIHVVYALRLPPQAIARRNSLRLAACFFVFGIGMIIWNYLSP